MPTGIYDRSKKRHYDINRPRKPLAERFWPKVDKRGPDDCWRWVAGSCHHGYGRIGLGGHDGVTALATRVSWELHNGTIPEGLFVCHSCDNPACVNPNHLFLGDQSINMKDASSKGRVKRGTRHHNAKLSEGQAVAIRNADMSGIDLSKKFGVSRSVISEIRNGKSWAHV